MILKTSTSLRKGTAYLFALLISVSFSAFAQDAKPTPPAKPAAAKPKTQPTAKAQPAIPVKSPAKSAPKAESKPAAKTETPAPATTGSKNVVEKIVAIVDDEPLLLSDVNDFSAKIKNNGLVDDALLEFYDRKKIAADKEAMVQYLIDEKLIDNQVKRAGIQAPIEKVEGEIRNILNARGLSREQLRDTLAKRGVKFSDYQDFIKTGIQRQSLVEREVSSKIKISDDDIATYYIQKNLSSKALVFNFDLAHIVFLTPKSDDEEKNAKVIASARAKAQDLKAKLAAGGNFEALASKHSEDPNFTQGGKFGEFRMGDLVPAVEKAVYKLNPGETSEIVQMADGFHVFKVLKRSLVPSADFERRKSEIGGILFKDAFQRQFRLWIEQMKRAAYIRVNTANG